MIMVMLMAETKVVREKTVVPGYFEHIFKYRYHLLEVKEKEVYTNIPKISNRPCCLTENSPIFS